MNIIDRMDNILFEASKVPKSIKEWVADYIIALDDGNKKLAREMKSDIESEIKSLGLDKEDVFNVFGDLDDRREKDRAVKKARDFQNK